ncbi:MAG: intermembrane transport protein PqiB [Thiotrichales bacterium]
MTEPRTDDLPLAQVERARRLSLVWLVPLVAALAGGWLFVHTWSERGPTITIMFEVAEGLEIGKTRVRYKDVDVGRVTDLQLTDDLQKVVVTAEVNRSMGAHLNENSRFWIVRPRVSTSGVSGLSTLISGIFITLDPSVGDEKQRQFQGLSEPPRVTSTLAGRSFILQAEALGALDIGSPVYYRQLKVGEVTQVALAPDGTHIEIGVFVKHPYADFVRQNSRFWNASGFDLDLTSEGISARLESLSSLVLGGISFDTPLNLAPGEACTDGHVFRLFPDYASINDKPYNVRQLFVMYFDGTLRGLNVGAPVEFRGIRVGKVLDIDLRMNPRDHQVDMPVLVELYPEVVSIRSPGDAFDEPEEKARSLDQSLEALIERGLRAQLNIGNLLTGQRFIDLEFQPKAGPRGATRSGEHAIFPTVPTTLDEIARTATGLVAKLEQMPLQEIAQDLRETLKAVRQIATAKDTQRSIENLAGTLESVRELATALNREAAPTATQLRGTLAQLDKTLQTMRGSLGDDSPLYYELRQLLEELAATARSFESLTDYLQRHPEALLRGKAEATR